MDSELRSRAKAVRKAAYRQLLIDTAERVFAAHGYEATKVQAIVAEAGLSLGTVYKLFTGKMAIYQAVHEERLRDLFTVAAAAVDRASGPRRMLLDGTRSFVRWMAEHPTYLEMNLREGYTWAASTRFPSPSQVEVWERGIGLVAAVFEAGMADGSLVVGEPETQARVLSAMQQVHITRWADADGAVDLEEMLAALDAQVARTFFTSAVVEDQPHG